MREDRTDIEPEALAESPMTRAAALSMHGARAIEDIPPDRPPIDDESPQA